MCWSQWWGKECLVCACVRLCRSVSQTLLTAPFGHVIVMAVTKYIQWAISSMLGLFICSWFSMGILCKFLDRDNSMICFY